MRILVLTDTTDYGPEATLYPLLRAASQRAEVAEIFVADRAIAENQSFYNVLGLDVPVLTARRADEKFCFENQTTYEPVSIKADEIDAVWLRLDLASDNFLRYVETIWADKFISNRPSGIMRTGTKAFLLSVQPIMGVLMPKVQLCYGLDNVQAFRDHCPDMVLKVLRSFGGKGVVRYRQNGSTDLHDEAEVEAFLAENGPCLAMQYLDNETQSDNRLVVSNGKVLGALARVPKPGAWLCNLMAGGSYGCAQADAREWEIVKRIDPAMRALGIHFYGVDTLLNASNERVLSEINTMNAGGAYRYELATGEPVCATIAHDFVDNALAARGEMQTPAAPLM